MDELARRLDLARKGGGILFCGAGFSADCLNFKPDETLGAGAQLLDIFNTALNQIPPYKNLQNAADALHGKIADNGMMTLLKEQFTVSNSTGDMTDLLRYPWQVVYTTNYDNALEIAAQAARRQVDSLNNTDDPKTATANLEIIHLHGYVSKWDIHNFRESCVLGAESYSKLTHVKSWLERFRRDIDQAQIVVFVGFNAGDFHLNQAINDLTGLRAKAFFINRPTANADPDIAAAQMRLGTPLFIGRSGFATIIKQLLAKEAPREPHLASFVKYTPPNPATTVPTQAEIEDLFLYGKIEPSQLARDASNDVSEYHIQRSAVQHTLDAIAGDIRIILYDGYACDGKSIVTTDVAYHLSGARPVYLLRQAYENILNEVAEILSYVPNAALIIENCFDLPRERLVSIARQFDGQGGVLILTSRAVALDASSDSLRSLLNFRSFQKITLATLSQGEARDLSELVDQIAGWRDFHKLDQDARLRFINDTCQASLPHFLLKLLRSDYVAGRYREEFSKLSLNKDERDAVIAALYITNIGENVPLTFLSNMMEIDYGALIDRINVRAGDGAFRLLRRNAGIVETIPSIGAQNILQNLFDDKEIVDTIVFVLKNLASVNRNHFEQRMFEQLMRFSILSKVVADSDAIENFFEHNKQKLQIRRRPLFWLQWHMAKCEVGSFNDAEKFLNQGYTEASEIERRTKGTYDRRQLNDRRAKFLMMRAAQTTRATADLFRDFREAILLNDKVLRQNDPQHYPFETLAEIVRTYNLVSVRLDSGHKIQIKSWLEPLVNYGRERIGVLLPGYQKGRAQSAINKAVIQ